MLGGNYVNRFSIQGRSYKVIPQVKRMERLTPDQLSQIYVKGSADQARAAFDVRHSARPRRSRDR
jgi:multidrug efflux pump